jgi:hypothetical protein
MFLSLAVIASAKVTSGGYVACFTESDFDEYNGASNKGRQYLLDNRKCLVLKGGLEYSYIDRGFLSSKIRVFFDKSSIVVWTPIENLR